MILLAAVSGEPAGTCEAAAPAQQVAEPINGVRPVHGATGPVELQAEARRRQAQAQARLQKSLLITGAGLFALGNALGWSGYFLWLDDLQIKSRTGEHAPWEVFAGKELTPRGGSVMIAGAVVATAGLVVAVLGYLVDAFPEEAPVVMLSPRPDGLLTSVGGVF